MGNQDFIFCKAALRIGIGPFLATVLASAPLFAAADDEDEPPIDPRRFQQERIAQARMVRLQAQPGLGAEPFKQQLSTRLRYLEHACHLSETQKSKLMLAAEVDQKRLDDACVVLRFQIRNLKQDDLAALGKLTQELNALQEQQANPLNDESLFGKTLHRLLDREQHARLARQLPREGYDQLVAQNLPILAGRIGLRGEQLSALTELLLWETDPPKKYGRFEYMFLLYQLSKVPKAKLKPLLDDWQQTRLEQQYVANAEAFLIQKGLVDEPADADDPAVLLPAEVQPDTDSPAPLSEVQP